jgi:parvulin-like peptidyl-prolyl isomerase
MRPGTVLISSLALIVLLAGGVQAPQLAAQTSGAVSDDTVVAQIGQTAYTLADIRRQLSRLEAPYRYAAERRLPEYVKELVRRDVLAQEARRLGLDREPAVRAQIEEAIQAVLIQALSKKMTSQAMPSPEEIRAYYNAHEAEFRLPEQVQVEQVLVPTEPQAEAIREAIAAGQAFEAAVEARTDATIDIATFPRGMRHSLVEEAAFALKPGEVSRPVPTRDGAYLFRLRARLPARLRSLEGSTPLIQARLSVRNLERLRTQLEDRLWTEEIVVREDLLKAAIPRTDSTASGTKASKTGGPSGTNPSAPAGEPGAPEL